MDRNAKLMAAGLFALLLFVGFNARGQGDEGAEGRKPSSTASSTPSSSTTRALRYQEESRTVTTPRRSTATPTPRRTSTGQKRADGLVMPTMRGRELQDSQDWLREQGAYLFLQRDAAGQGRTQVLDTNWKVCRTSPAAGKWADFDRRITLYAVKLDEDCPRAT